MGGFCGCYDDRRTTKMLEHTQIDEVLESFFNNLTEDEMIFYGMIGPPN